MIRRAILAIAAAAALVVPLTVAFPASANGAFDFEELSSVSSGDGTTPQFCYIYTVNNGSKASTFNAFGNPNCYPGDPAHSDFSLIFVENAGGKNWYEIEDLEPFGCFNVGSDTKVYNNSCSKTTTEQWAQIVVSDGQHWENRHYGTNGYLTLDCGYFSCPGTIVANGNPVSWGTPAS